MAEENAPKSPEEIEKWLAERPKPSPIPEQTEEQLNRAFGYYQDELHKVKEGKADHVEEFLIRFMLEQRLEIAQELHNRAAAGFKGTPPLENEGIDLEFFEALLLMEKEHFYKLAEAPPVLFNGLLWLDVGFDNPAGKRKWRIMGEADQLNNAIIWVHRIYENNKRIEREAKKARKRPK